MPSLPNLRIRSIPSPYNEKKLKPDFAGGVSRDCAGDSSVLLRQPRPLVEHAVDFASTLYRSISCEFFLSVERKFLNELFCPA